MYIYCVGVYIYTGMSMHMYIGICVYMHVYVNKCTVYVYVCVYTYVLHTCVSTHVHIHVYTHAHVCVYMFPPNIHSSIFLCEKKIIGKKAVMDVGACLLHHPGGQDHPLVVLGLSTDLLEHLLSYTGLLQPQQEGPFLLIPLAS